MDEVILWMNNSLKERLTPNTVMMCIRSTFILENDRDITPYEFKQILLRGNNACIIRASMYKRCKGCKRPICQRKLHSNCKQANVLSMETMPMNEYLITDIVAVGT